MNIENNAVEKAKHVELVLLREFSRICYENKLQWYADGGTLLGAVRHKGFIPWDDDIDIAMLRGDYDKLLQIGPAAFKPPFFFQSAYTDKDYFRPHVQLRMDRTLAALKNEYGRASFHQGVFIDIFPLDTVPEDGPAARRQWKHIRLYKRALNLLWGVAEGKGILHQSVRRLSQPIKKYIDREKLYARFEAECRRFEGQTDDITLLSFNAQYRQRLLKRQWYEETVMLPFEDLMIPAPVGYEHVLEAKYGDWRTPCDSGTMHGELIYQFDA